VEQFLGRELDGLDARDRARASVELLCVRTETVRRDLRRLFPDGCGRSPARSTHHGVHGSPSLQGWGFTRIASVQRRAGYSPKHFIALFRDAVGLTPKHYYRIKRFTAALQTLAEGTGAGLAELAASLGYADQSHLTREFRDFAGITPTQYRPRGPGSVLHHLATGLPSRGPGEGKDSSIIAEGDARR
jgi:AraC-like DNA-binding protein